MNLRLPCPHGGAVVARSRRKSLRCRLLGLVPGRIFALEYTLSLPYLYRVRSIQSFGSFNSEAAAASILWQPKYVPSVIALSQVNLIPTVYAVTNLLLHTSLLGPFLTQ